jgi:hypothetical protein
LAEEPVDRLYSPTRKDSRISIKKTTISIAVILIVLACAILLSSNLRKNRFRTVSLEKGIVVPTATAQRFGVYNWNIDAPPCTPPCDLLNYGASKVEATGSRTIRVYLGPSQVTSYRLNFPSGATLAQIAQLAAYHTLFTNPAFDNYLLTTYSNADEAHSWADGFTPDEYAAEREEVRALGDYLLSNANFAGKTFIILNWEGDNAIAHLRNKRIAWDAYRDWIQSRADGVALARSDYSSSSTRLYSGLEFNAVEMNGRICGTTLAQTGEDPLTTDPYKYRCVIDNVAPNVTVDYYSYSAWGSMAVKVENPSASLKTVIKNALDIALNQVKSLRPKIDQTNFIIGEFGFSREIYGECNTANYIDEIFDAVNPLDPEAFHPSFVILWQILDNAPIFITDRGGFGLYKFRNGSLHQTRAFTTFQQRINNQKATVQTKCPALRTSPPESIPGVVDSKQGSGPIHLNPDSLLSIYVPNCCQNPANPFSPSGNTVHLDQGHRRLTGRILSQSSSQIRAALNPARRPGLALIYVSDASSIDSNSIVINLTCSTCPKISSVEAGSEQLTEYYPGSEITINGELFSATGNTVFIEQIDGRNIVQSHVLTPTFQSPTLIKAILPAELLINRMALVYVASSQNVQSNDFPIGISRNCQMQNCSHPPPPVIRAKNGIVNPASNTTEFRQNDLAVISGSRFSDNGDHTNSGNKVIVEQYTNSPAGTLVKTYTITGGSSPPVHWWEGANRISFQLPTGLSPGRAVIYVVDAQGRETTAREIVISQ